MLGNMPEITVLMSVYNGARWLGDSIDSVLSQSEEDFEFIVINDGSTDDTALILDSYNDNRLVVKHQKNIGLTKSLNVGLSIAKGKYLARIDADDICMPDRFHKQKQFLIENPDVALVGSNAILIDDKGNDVGYAAYPNSHDDLLQRLRKLQTVFPHSSILIRKGAIAGEGGYNPRFTRSQDSDLYLRLSEQYKLASLNQALVKLRLNESSLTYSNMDLQLKMGIAALISYYRRNAGLKDFSRSDDDDWQLFFEQIEEWVKKKKYDKKRDAKINFKCFRTMIKQKEFSNALLVLYECFKSDFLFFLYRDINFKVPADLKQFSTNTSLV